MRLQMCTTDRWCPTVMLCWWCRGFPKSTCYAFNSILDFFLGQLAIFLFLHLKYEKMIRIGLGSIIQMDQVLLTCSAAVEGGDAATGRQLVFPCLEVFVVHYELCHVEYMQAYL
ncbi:hypothetical protein NC651_002360 [Populus alba x Populus x berolinensis]|nr:hypothetical protein NC651_002360 [Populus alba x Populus x berolinensis]